MSRRFQNINWNLIGQVVAVLLCPLAFLVVAQVFVAIFAPLDFGGNTEFKALTYSRYLAEVSDAWFDPVGASDIYHRCYSTRDGYDAWWRFVIAEHECDRLVALVAEKNDGPNVIDWNTTADCPPSWKPDEAPPKWWLKNPVAGSRAVFWCHRAGDAERHHGWFLLYETQSQTLYCWHWNHQWSSNQCRQPNE